MFIALVTYWAAKEIRVTAGDFHGCYEILPPLLPCQTLGFTSGISV